MQKLSDCDYEFEKSPPTPAMDQEKYKEIVVKEWDNLIKDPQSQNNESLFQKFFELHPCMLPISSHCYPQAIISQPVLPDFTSKIPDFMAITCDSMSLYVYMIEIEAPKKPWFTKNGVQHHKLTQAIGQIKDWQAHFSDPLNIEKFKDHYRLDQFRRMLVVQPRYILIYGRRDEATKNPEYAKKRSHLQNSTNETFMTYDRLETNYSLMNHLTVKIDKKGYSAISIPPTITVGPMVARYLNRIRNKETAIRKCRYLSDERIAFLERKFVYCDNWYNKQRLERRIQTISIKAE